MGSSPVEEYILEQDDKSRAAIYEAVEVLCEEFPNIKNESIKPLKGKIWELRVTDYRGRQHRLLYVVIGRNFIILHVFTKKTRKTPVKDLQLAERRLKDVLSEGG